MKLFKSLLIILVLPAILVLVATFQGYADDNMTLNTLETMFMDFLPFIVVGLFILGVFMAIRSKGGGSE